MSAEIIPLGRQLQRMWRLTELAPGKWCGELIERGGGVLRRTEIGDRALVEDAVSQSRRGLPIKVVPLRTWDGPSAA